MVEYIIIPLIAALVAGTAPFWLRLIWDRVRIDLNLVSVTKGRHPEERADVGDRIMEISKSFRRSPLDLPKEARDRDIQFVRSHAKGVRKEALEQIEFAREMKRRLRHCKENEEKVDFITKLMTSGKLVLEEIIEGLQRRDLVLPKIEDTLRMARYVCQVETVSSGDVDSIVLTRPEGRIDFPVGSQGAKDRIQPLVKAMQTFNKRHLDKCLKYAVKAVRDDRSHADILMSGLEEIASSGPFRVDLMVVNKGKYAAVLNPYAALRVSGGVSRIDPLMLRIENMLDPQNGELEVEVEVDEPSYVSIEPRSTVILTLRSEPVEAHKPIAAAYDKGILRCSVALVRLTNPRAGKYRPKLVETVSKDFGASFDKVMRNQVEDRVRRRTRRRVLNFPARLSPS
ncbi:hypothetical protein [Streptomyces sp. NPDC059850]|uniref:hypothetical protein n=1 Tax=Streptomyces sp. NPDC059850 TaxID=3346970 RepID=UPI0036634451